MRQPRNLVARRRRLRRPAPGPTRTGRRLPPARALSAGWGRASRPPSQVRLVPDLMEALILLALLIAQGVSTAAPHPGPAAPGT